MTATVESGSNRVATTTRAARADAGHSPGWWGVVCLIGTEAMLFALLLFGNFYLRSSAPAWPPRGISDPEIPKSAIRTLVLLGSTLPAVVAERAARRRDRPTTMAGLALTAAMGSAFLAGHVDEYVMLWKEFRPSTAAYGSAFYTIASLHALHVVIGVIVMGFLLWRTARDGEVSDDDARSVGVGILYWHFVDVVWVVVYSSLYLSVSL